MCLLGGLVHEVVVNFGVLRLDVDRLPDNVLHQPSKRTEKLLEVLLRFPHVTDVERTTLFECHVKNQFVGQSTLTDASFFIE